MVGWNSKDFDLFWCKMGHKFIQSQYISQNLMTFHGTVHMEIFRRGGLHIFSNLFNIKRFSPYKIMNCERFFRTFVLSIHAGRCKVHFRNGLGQQLWWPKWTWPIYLMYSPYIGALKFIDGKNFARAYRARFSFFSIVPKMVEKGAPRDPLLMYWWWYFWKWEAVWASTLND